MYKKLMFLISLVCLLGLSAGARAEDLEVGPGETLIITDLVECESFLVEGTLIVESTGTLISDGSDDRSTINGNEGDGPGGTEYARLIINGGEVIVQSRVNIGQGYDGRLIVNDGGSFWQGCCGDDWGDGFKFPDDPYGEHFITVNDGTVDVHKFETRTERHAKLELGCPSLVRQRNASAGEYRENPQDWIDSGDAYCLSGCAGPIVEWNDSQVDVYCFVLPPYAWGEAPDDGSAEICPDVCLTWEVGGGDMGLHPGDKHYVFFGDSYTAVDEAEIGDPEYIGFKPVGLEEYCPPDLELWTTYYWRIDEKPFGQPTVKGMIWSFTTGCEIMPGDINLDCVVDGIDYAMLADDWAEEAFFPDDF
jgi:hypothetical protein